MLYPLNEEEPIKASGEETVSMNMFIFNISIFEKLEKDFKVFLDKYINDIKAEFQLPEKYYFINSVKNRAILNEIWD